MEMKQDDAWLKKYVEVVSFIETNKRNPSRFMMKRGDGIVIG